jgi:hypothetical protein
VGGDVVGSRNTLYKKIFLNIVVGDLDAFLGFLVRVVSPPERLYNPLQLLLGGILGES